MRRYWTRIILGALGVFALGMIILNVGRRGVDQVRNLAEGYSFDLASRDAAFMVDGRRLGGITAVDVNPGVHGEFPRINLVVQLDSAVSFDSLAACTLVAGSPGELGDGTGITCGTGLSLDSLEAIGTVVADPGGHFPIYISRSALPGPVAEARAGAAHESAAAVITVREHRAFMLINDPSGRPIFQLNADSSGAFIQLRDSSGKEIFRFNSDGH